MDVGTHIWHPPQIVLQGQMTSQREEPGIEIGLGLSLATSNALSNL